jgi:hypothetical protein
MNTWTIAKVREANGKPHQWHVQTNIIQKHLHAKHGNDCSIVVLTFVRHNHYCTITRFESTFGISQ